MNDEKPERDEKLYPEALDAKELMKLLPPSKEPDPRGTSLLRGLYQNWKLSDRIRKMIEEHNDRMLKDYFDEVYGSIESQVRTLALADETWELFVLNRDTHMFSPNHLFIMLCDAGYELAIGLGLGFTGNQQDWYFAVREAGDTHDKRMRNGGIR